MGAWCFLFVIFGCLVMLLEKPMTRLRYYSELRAAGIRPKRTTNSVPEQKPKWIVPKKEFTGKELEEFEIREKFREYYNSTTEVTSGFISGNVTGRKVYNWDYYRQQYQGYRYIWWLLRRNKDIIEHTNNYLSKLSFSEYMLPIWNESGEILFSNNRTFIELLVKKCCKLYNISYRFDYYESKHLQYAHKYYCGDNCYQVKLSFKTQEEVDRFYKTFDTIINYYEKTFDKMISEATTLEKLMLRYGYIPAYNPSTKKVKSQFLEPKELKRVAKKLKEPYDIGL
jgi:hypothetical protein